MSVCSGWNVQQMNAVKPPVSSCSWRRRSRCSIRSASVSMWPNIIVAVDRPPSSCQTRWTFEPFVGQHLAAGDRLADAIDEDLAAAAGQAAQARLLEPLAGPSRSGSLVTLVKW